MCNLERYRGFNIESYYVCCSGFMAVVDRGKNPGFILFWIM